jgi:hypothetical protein
LCKSIFIISTYPDLYIQQKISTHMKISQKSSLSNNGNKWPKDAIVSLENDIGAQKVYVDLGTNCGNTYIEHMERFQKESEERSHNSNNDQDKKEGKKKK